MVVCILVLLSQFDPPSLCPQVCSLCLGLYSCSANRFISTIFLDSIYICINILYLWSYHSSTLAWKIPQTEVPGRLLSIGSQWVGHNWNDLACTHASWTHLISSACLSYKSIYMWSPILYIGDPIYMWSHISIYMWSHLGPTWITQNFLLTSRSLPLPHQERSFLQMR